MGRRGVWSCHTLLLLVVTAALINTSRAVVVTLNGERQFSVEKTLLEVHAELALRVVVPMERLHLDSLTDGTSGSKQVTHALVLERLGADYTANFVLTKESRGLLLPALTKAIDAKTEATSNEQLKKLIRTTTLSDGKIVASHNIQERWEMRQEILEIAREKANDWVLSGQTDATCGRLGKSFVTGVLGKEFVFMKREGDHTKFEERREHWKAASNLVKKYLARALALRIEFYGVTKALMDGTKFVYYSGFPFRMDTRDQYADLISSVAELSRLFGVDCGIGDIELAGSSLSFFDPDDYDLGCRVSEDRYEAIYQAHYPKLVKQEISIKKEAALERCKLNFEACLRECENSEVQDCEMKCEEEFKACGFDEEVELKKVRNFDRNDSQFASGGFARLEPEDSQYEDAVALCGGSMMYHKRRLNGEYELSFYTCLKSIAKRLGISRDVHFTILSKDGKFGVAPLMTRDRMAISDPDTFLDIPTGDDGLMTMLETGSRKGEVIDDEYSERSISCAAEAAKVAFATGISKCVRCDRKFQSAGGYHTRGYHCRSEEELEVRGLMDASRCVDARDIDVMCFTYGRRRCVCGPYNLVQETRWGSPLGG